jgi:hypothetical protein
VDDAARDDGEIFEATVFLHHFKELTDTRQQAKVVYPLDEVLLLALLVYRPRFLGHRIEPYAALTTG